MEKLLRKLSAPIFVDLSITNKCNLNCIYCYACADFYKDDTLSLEEIKGLCDQFDDMGVHYVRLAGGEPLLHPRFDEITGLISRYNFLCSVSTNGVSLNKQLVKSIKKSGIDWVVVSLDGSTEKVNNQTRGAYSKVIQGIELLVANSIKTRIATVVTSNNCENLEDMVELAEDLGVQGVGFILYSPVGRALDNLDKIGMSFAEQRAAVRTINRLRKIKKIDINLVFPHESYLPWELESALSIGEIEAHWLNANVDLSKRIFGCNAGRTTCSIASNGDVYGCEQLMNYEELKAGNIKQSSFMSIWRASEVFEKLRKIELSDLHNDCQRCTMRGCGGGCRAIAYGYNHDLHGKDRRCESIRELIS